MTSEEVYGCDSFSSEGKKRKNDGNPHMKRTEVTFTEMKTSFSNGNLIEPGAFH